MKIYKIWDDSPNEKQLQQIARDLDDGQLMLWPTDTLYGLACDAFNTKAVDRLCRIKGINPEKTNLSIVCSDISQASEYARISDAAFRLMREYTPGPVTFLFKASQTLPKVFKSRKTVGIRIPDCRTSLAIVRELGRPVLTTSIEFDDEDYAIDPELIAEANDSFADFMVENGSGRTSVSAIIDCTTDTPTLIRQGVTGITL